MTLFGRFTRGARANPLFTPAQLAEVAAAIAEVERRTDAELVTVLARRADSYGHVPVLWAALAALLAPVVLKFTPLWLSGDDLLLAQWGVFAALALVLHIPALHLRLVPRATQRGCAENLARRQFLANNLHHTRGETGVLIFVAEAERWVEIIADRGISQHVANGEWQAIVDRFIAQVKAGATHAGMLECIHACGDLLAFHVPVTSQKNELPNHLVVLP